MTNEHSSYQKLETFVHQNNMRNSIERKIVLDEIIAFDQHFTAQKLHEQIRISHPISLASVYNNIEILLRAAIIVKHPFPGREAEFELTERAIKHHHRICSCCGRVKEFNDDRLTKMAHRPHKSASFTSSFNTVYVYGICKDCQCEKR